MREKPAFVPIPELYSVYEQCRSVSTDTRNIAPGDIFFALKGDRFNANAFAAEALQAGAEYAVIDAESCKKDGRFLLVEDVLSALQGLAKHYRGRLSIPVVGITGTNGKTTTKELMNAVLGQRYRVHATRGNLNNHIGVPLTLLSVPENAEIAIIEMGANHPGEIAFLCGIAEPTHGLVTNVGKAHLEGFGSFDGVRKAKAELYDFLSERNGTLFLQSDNAHLLEMADRRNIRKVLRYGCSAGNDVVGRLERADPFLSASWTFRNGKPNAVRTRLTGSYNMENLLAAVAVGQAFGLSAEEINRGLESYEPANSRSQLVRTATNTVIADHYNANSESMAAALDNIAALQAGHKTVVLGDMFEMGEASEEEHRKVAEKALSIGADRVVFVGKAFFAQRNLGKGAKATFCETTEEARAAIAAQPIKNSLVLLKASRGMAFEKLLELMTNDG